jgi:hypothetical protein
MQPRSIGEFILQETRSGVPVCKYSIREYVPGDPYTAD